MKKLFLFGLWAFTAVLVNAETPTVASAGIRLYYCTPDATTTEYYIGANETYHWEEYTLTKADIGRTDIKHTYVNKAGCDSVVTLNLKQAFIFSVSATQTVMFSPGNLQYLADDGTGNLKHKVRPKYNNNYCMKDSTGTFRFAEHQWTVIGQTTDNVSPSKTATTWIDLFAYGSDGSSVGTVPYSTDNVNRIEMYIPVPKCDAQISGNWGDWGYTNNIVNGTEEDSYGTWRILSKTEWEYLIGEYNLAAANKRQNAQSLHGVGTVNGVTGLIILPDEWLCPTGLTFNAGIISSGRDYTSNIYDAGQWAQMEAAGAVFLPTMAYYSNGSMATNDTPYWTGSRNSEGSLSLFFTNTWIQVGSGQSKNWYDRCRMPVRLVRNL